MMLRVHGGRRLFSVAAMTAVWCSVLQCLAMSFRVCLSFCVRGKDPDLITWDPWNCPGPSTGDLPVKNSYKIGDKQRETRRMKDSVINVAERLRKVVAYEQYICSRNPRHVYPTKI